MYKLGKKSWKKLVGVHPILSFAVSEAIKLTTQDFLVVEGVRTLARQKELVKKGYSKTMNSYHLYGLAVDLVPFVNGGMTFDDKYFNGIRKAMKEVIKKYDLPIENGYDKWGWDKPHWQMTGFRNEYDIRKIKPKCFGG